jgi:uncharacterized protein
MTSIFLQLAQKIITEEKRPLSPNEIWDIAISKGYDKNLGSLGKTPSASLGAMLYVDVRDNPKTIFISVGVRPKRFFLKTLPKLTETQVQEIQPPKIEINQINYLEKDLHPFLVYYGFYYLKAYVKTIHHNKSDKKEFGEWVHPDLVGCYFPYTNWENEVVEISSTLGNSAIKLYSFEMKRELKIGNLREAFFQAVSNSSWANEGYLVASYVDPDSEFLGELKRLSSSFGIGVIRLDIEDPDSSGILFPARSKDYIDWETVNKLSGMNSDFREFLKRIKNDVSSREVRKELYDKVFEKDQLLKLIS